MKQTLALASLPAVLFATLATADAQPSDAPAPAPATANGKSDVSELDHQLVQVGDQNKYKYSYKKYNISTNPLGLIYGSYGISASYAFSDHVAVRGDLNYYNPVDSDLHGFELAAGAPIYFRKMYSGVFVEPGLSIQELWADTTRSSGTAASSTGDNSTTVFGPQVLIGYHWYWDSGLNIAIAAGIGRNWNASNNDAFDGYDKIFPNGYLRFGYAF